MRFQIQISRGKFRFDINMLFAGWEVRTDRPERANNMFIFFLQ